MGGHLNVNSLRRIDRTGKDGLKKNRFPGDRMGMGASPGVRGWDDVVGTRAETGVGKEAWGAGVGALGEASGLQDQVKSPNIQVKWCWGP